MSGRFFALFILFVVMSSGCVGTELIEPSGNIVLLGKLHYPNGTTFFDRETAIYSMGELLVLGDSGWGDFYLKEVYVSGSLEERGGVEYFVANEIREADLYDTEVMNKKLFLTLKNPLSVSLTDLVVKIRNGAGEKIDLYPGESRTLTWSFESCEDMQLSIPVEVKSEMIYEGLENPVSGENGEFFYLDGTILIDSEECPRPARIVTDVVNTKEVVTGCEEFDVFVTLENIGDMPAEEIDTKLLLPPGLYTSDPTIKRIGVLNAHEKKSISWNIVPERTGSFGFNVVSIYGYEFSKGVGEIRSVEYEHEIEITLENSSKNVSVVADEFINAPDYIEKEIFLHNHGEVEDFLNIEYVVSDKGIVYGLYDGQKRILSDRVNVTGNSTRKFSLRIFKYPDYEIHKTEEINVCVWSEKDTTARDSVSIKIEPP